MSETATTTADAPARSMLKRLYQAYVGTLETGRDRIIALGGTCDAVDVMEAGDPALRAVRDFLAEPAPPPSAAQAQVANLKAALEAIAGIKTTDVVAYCREADGIAVDALVKLEVSS